MYHDYGLWSQMQMLAHNRIANEVGAGHILVKQLFRLCTRGASDVDMGKGKSKHWGFD